MERENKWKALICCSPYDQGTSPKPATKLEIFQYMGQWSINWATPKRAICPMFKKWKLCDIEMVSYLLSSSSNENTNTCFLKTRLMILTSFSEWSQKISLVINHHLGIKISIMNSLLFYLPQVPVYSFDEGMLYFTCLSIYISLI